MCAYMYSCPFRHVCGIHVGMHVHTWYCMYCRISVDKHQSSKNACVYVSIFPFRLDSRKHTCIHITMHACVCAQQQPRLGKYRVSPSSCSSSFKFCSRTMMLRWNRDSAANAAWSAFDALSMSMRWHTIFPCAMLCISAAFPVVEELIFFPEPAGKNAARVG
jgi:hypothetical protein